MAAVKSTCRRGSALCFAATGRMRAGRPRDGNLFPCGGPSRRTNVSLIGSVLPTSLVLALGTVVLRMITGKNPRELLEQLHRVGYGVTVVEGQGATGPVKVVLTVVPRRELATLTAIIKAVDPKMFYSVDEIQSASEGIFPIVRGRSRPFALFRPRLSRAA